MEDMKTVQVCLVLLYFQQEVTFILADSDVFQNTDLENDEKCKISSIAEKQKKVSVELKNFYRPVDPLCKNYIDDYNNLMLSSENYVQRFVSLFLIMSNLQSHEIKDPEEVINLDLELSITGNDLSFLQEYSKKQPKNAYFRNLHKIDLILSKIARLKEKSYLEETLKSYKFSLSDFIYWYTNNNSFYLNHFWFLAVTIVFTWTIYYFFSNKSLSSLVFICISILNIIIIWESSILYRKKLKEVEVETYVRGLKFKEIPEECDPAKFSWFYDFKNLFFNDNCLEYYKNLNIVPTEEVSFVQCIIERYGLVFVQTPLRIFGMSIKDITGQISDSLPFPFNLIVYIPLSICLTVCFGIFILLCFGKRLRMSLPGFSVNVDNDKKSPIDDAGYVTSKKVKKLPGIKSAKNFRLSTKYKYLFRLDLKPGRRQKLNLKPAQKEICMR